MVWKWLLYNIVLFSFTDVHTFNDSYEGSLDLRWLQVLRKLAQLLRLASVDCDPYRHYRAVPSRGQHHEFCAG